MYNGCSPRPWRHWCSNNCVDVHLQRNHAKFSEVGVESSIRRIHRIGRQVDHLEKPLGGVVPMPKALISHELHGISGGVHPQRLLFTRLRAPDALADASGCEKDAEPATCAHARLAHCWWHGSDASTVLRSGPNCDEWVRDLTASWSARFSGMARPCPARDMRFDDAEVAALPGHVPGRRRYRESSVLSYPQPPPW